MPDRNRSGRSGTAATGRGRLWAALAAAAALAGCTTAGPFFGGGVNENDSPAAGRELGAAIENGADGELAVYFETMRRLIDGDTLTQAETFADAENAAVFTENTTNRLRYALALSVPGHAGSDPEAAAARLRALLASGLLLPEERVLAAMQLKTAEQLTLLETANVSLREELASSIAERDAANAERVNALLEENRRLQRQLEDATERLDAITSIEQSISEREDDQN